MNGVKLVCSNLSKKYINKLVFKGVNFELLQGDSLAVTGRNGSGKSTLVKILSGLIKQTAGEINLSIDGNEVIHEKRFLHYGLISPYLNLYDELTAFENLNFFYKLKCKDSNGEDKINLLLEKVNLLKRKDDFVKDYSSGMKQRLKLAFSVISDPKVLFMDEPRSNLDEEGIAIAYGIAEEQKQRGILIIATNEKEDTSLCNKFLSVEEYK